MAFCTNCGAKLDDGQAFCTQCGHRVEDGVTGTIQAPAAAPVPIVDSQGRSAGAAPGSGRAESVPSSTGGRSRRRMGVAVAIICAVIAAIGLATFFIIGFTTQPSSTESAGQNTYVSMSSQTPDEFLTAEGYPYLPGILRIVFLGSGVSEGSDLSFDGLVDELGLQLGSDGTASGNFSGGFLGFDSYRLTVPAGWIGGGSTAGSQGKLSIVLEDTTADEGTYPPGLTFDNFMVFLRDDANEFDEGELLGFWGDQQVIDEVNSKYLASEDAPDLSGFDTDDARELLSLLGVDPADVSVGDQTYCREDLSYSYLSLIEIFFAGGGTDQSNPWGYQYAMEGTIDVDGHTVYVDVDADWAARMEPLTFTSEGTTIRHVATTRALHPSIVVTFSLTRPSNGAGTVDEGLSEEDGRFLQVSSSPFPPSPTFDYGLVDLNEIMGDDPVSGDEIAYILAEDREGAPTYTVDGHEVPDTKSGYIIQYSDTVPLTTDAVRQLSDTELWLARNEIYARHGHGFSRAELLDWFGRQPWYSRRDQPTPVSLLEDMNVDVIQAEEARRNSPYAVD